MKNHFKQEWKAMPCPCGAEVCSSYLVEPIASSQGLQMTRQDAMAIEQTPEMAKIIKILGGNIMTPAEFNDIKARAKKVLKRIRE